MVQAMKKIMITLIGICCLLAPLDMLAVLQICRICEVEPEPIPPQSCPPGTRVLSHKLVYVVVDVTCHERGNCPTTRINVCVHCTIVEQPFNKFECTSDVGSPGDPGYGP